MTWRYRCQNTDWGVEVSSTSVQMTASALVSPCVPSPRSAEVEGLGFYGHKKYYEKCIKASSLPHKCIVTKIKVKQKVLVEFSHKWVMGKMCLIPTVAVRIGFTETSFRMFSRLGGHGTILPSPRFSNKCSWCLCPALLRIFFGMCSILMYKHTYTDLPQLEVGLCPNKPIIYKLKI